MHLSETILPWLCSSSFSRTLLAERRMYFEARSLDQGPSYVHERT